MINTPDSPAQMLDDRMILGGEFWTLFCSASTTSRSTVWISALMEPFPVEWAGQECGP